MLSVLIGCRQFVGSLWVVCGYSLKFYSLRSFINYVLFINTVLYSRFILYLTTYLSTTLDYLFNLFLTYFYPSSTWPTTTVTKYINYCY